MTSPYIDPSVQKHRGRMERPAGLGTVSYAQNLLPYNSDGVKVGGYVPKENMISGAGQQRDQRKRQNPGFSL